MHLDLKTTSKASLVFILVLMQLIAPLVHGHAGVDERATGLHIHLTETNQTAKAAKDKSITASATIRGEAMAVSIVTGHSKNFRSPFDSAPSQAISSLSFQSNSRIESFVKLDSFLFAVATLSPPERAPPAVFST